MDFNFLRSTSIFSCSLSIVGLSFSCNFSCFRLLHVPINVTELKKKQVVVRLFGSLDDMLELFLHV